MAEALRGKELTLPETVYGGEVDAVTWDGQETWKTLTLDGTEEFEFNNIYDVFYIPTNRYSASSKDIAPMSNFYKGVLGFSYIQNAQVGVSGGVPGWLFGIKDERFETISAFSSYLAAQSTPREPPCKSVTSWQSLCLLPQPAHSLSPL